MIDHKTEIETLFNGTLNVFELLLHLAIQSNSNTLHYSQEMKADDAEEFKLAMNKEIDNLLNNDVFEIIPLSENPKTKS